MQAVTAFAKHKVKDKLADKVQNMKPSYETDPEVIAAAQEAAALQERRWWKKEKPATPDMILDKSERKLLHKVKNRAFYLDKGLQCGCFNIGLDGVVGMIPGIGDFICLVFSLQLIRTACRADLPASLITRMVSNVIIDFAIGLVPIAGDLLDILFKCNWRNYLLLEEYLILRKRDALRLEKGKNRSVSDDVTLMPSSSLNPPPIMAQQNDRPSLHSVSSAPLPEADEVKYGTFR
ncbi:hypothetical protein BDB01DRAFT_794590 [Pilobolus umbonatus]|nr:hypothetical protein BDB01DRAFT_794590 [Pilobolus umbonatus]